MSQFQVVVTFSSAPTLEAAVAETQKQLQAEAGAGPVKGGLVYASLQYPANELQPKLKAALPGVPFAGATSCGGVGAGANGFQPRGLTALWLVGPEVKFGVALQEKGSGKALAQAALDQAGISAGAAKLAVLHSTPGGEEALLAGIFQVLGKKTPLLGGSAADNDLTGKWCSFTQEGVSASGVALAVADVPGRVVFQYLGAHIPTGRKGVVTAASGRVLQGIDGRPAAEVYNEWTGNRFGSLMKTGANVLSMTTLIPLGVHRKSQLGSTHVLVHPESITAPKGEITLFAEVRVGETVELMQGTVPGLVDHVGRVSKWALGASGVTANEVLGGLLIYCAGCMLTIDSKKDEMLGRLRSEIKSDRFVAMFPYGEQGCFMESREHGNLMTGVLLFAR